MNFLKSFYKSVTFYAISGGAVSVIFSVVNLSFEKFDWQLAILAFITVFGSSILHFQLPRTKIHFSIADVLILYAVLRYDIAIAVLLALFESLSTSYSLKKQGISIKPKTFALNAALHTFSIFITAFALYSFFDPVTVILENSHFERIFILILLISATMFLGNTFLAAGLVAERTGNPYWKIWKKSFFNIGLLYLTDSIFAVVSFRLASQVNLFVISVVCALAIIVYLTYRYYVEDIKKSSALAEQAENERRESELLRVEEAEKHIIELKELLTEQERISNELLESKNQFRHAAFHDNLTGLPNRNWLEDKLTPILQESRRSAEKNFALLYIDVNSFKHINESLGYSMGNEMLKAIARRLNASANRSEFVARFGGDEFALVIASIPSENYVFAKAEELAGKFAEAFGIKGSRIFTSISIGIAVGNADYESVEDIMRDAEIALDHAKKKGKPYAVFNRSMHELMLEKIETEADLRRAIKKSEFCLFYQPIVDLRSLEVCGFEALIRWKHPQKGLLAPYKFIPVAEDTGLIIPMTEWILREACCQVKIWQKEFKSNLTISVNISGKHFGQANLVELVGETLKETGFTPSKLKLEITESATMEDAEKTVEILKRLKDLGVKLMIDDFGTGYSSLNYLHKFPLDTLKVDRSFVNMLVNADENDAIVNTIISMAKNLQLDVVAEGIETVEQLERLISLDCEKGQGYFFSKPIDAADMESFLQKPEPWRTSEQPKIFLPEQEKLELDTIQ